MPKKPCPDAKFCPVPFNELVYTSQMTYAVCCAMEENHSLIATSNDALDHYNSDTMVDLRNRLLSGEPTPECAPCWNDEKNNKISARMRRNFNFYGQHDIRNRDVLEFRGIQEPIYQTAKNNGEYHLDSLYTMHISVGNRCQLRCIHCSPAYSSSILKDYKTLGWAGDYKAKRIITTDQKAQELAHWNSIKQNTLRAKHTLRIIRLTGGEPSINKHCIDFLRWCVDNNIAQNLAINAATNSANIKDEFIALIKQFKHPMFLLSVDGVGELDEYLRYPTNWDKKQIQLEKLASEFPESTLHTVVYSLNVLDVDKIYNWGLQFSLRHQFEMLDYPEELSVRHLPENLKEIAIQKIKQIKLKPEHDMANNGILAIIRRLEEPRDPAKWAECKRIIAGYDSIRKKTLHEIVPEFQLLG